MVMYIQSIRRHWFLFLVLILLKLFLIFLFYNNYSNPLEKDYKISLSLRNGLNEKIIDPGYNVSALKLIPYLNQLSTKRVDGKQNESLKFEASSIYTDKASTKKISTRFDYEEHNQTISKNFSQESTIGTRTVSYTISSKKFKLKKPATFKKNKQIPNDLRKYVNTEEELELTKIVKTMPTQCLSDKRFSIFIKTRPNSFKRRQTLRKTWVSDVKSRNISVFFAIGLAVDKKDQKLIEDESKKYGDLLQLPFIDSYHNLTLKSIGILRFSENHCKTNHVLSADDDVIVNIDSFLVNLDQFKYGIHGHGKKLMEPILNGWSKWYMPKILWSKDYYTEYLFGFGYLYSGYCVKDLVKGIDTYDNYVIYIDDVFITGILAEKNSVPRYIHSTFFGIDYSCSNECRLKKLAVYLECNTDEKIERFWTNWVKNKSKC